MTGYFYATDFTVPAGTPIATPTTLAVSLEDLHLDVVRFVIPEGHSGLTGVAVKSGGVNIAPYVQGSWLTGNDEIIDFPYDGEIQQNLLTLFGYNTDIFPHTFHLRWTLSDLSAPTPVVIESPQAPGVPPVTAAATIGQLTGALTAAQIDQLNAAAAADQVFQDVLAAQ